MHLGARFERLLDQLARLGTFGDQQVSTRAPRARRDLVTPGGGAAAGSDARRRRSSASSSRCASSSSAFSPAARRTLSVLAFSTSRRASPTSRSRRYGCRCRRSSPTSPGARRAAAARSRRALRSSKVTRRRARGGRGRPPRSSARTAATTSRPGGAGSGRCPPRGRSPRAGRRADEQPGVAAVGEQHAPAVGALGGNQRLDEGEGSITTFPEAAAARARSRAARPGCRRRPRRRASRRRRLRVPRGRRARPRRRRAAPCAPRG